MPEAYESLFKVGQPQGEREEKWLLIPGTDIGISTYGRCHTKIKPKMHFGYFDKSRKNGRVRHKGVWYHVLKLCKQHFPKEEWDFVDPFWEEAQAQAADSSPVLSLSGPK